MTRSVEHCYEVWGHHDHLGHPTYGYWVNVGMVVDGATTPWSWASLRSELDCSVGIDGCDTCERRNRRVRPWFTSERRPEPSKP